jgi:hypothetical protein
LKKCVGYVKSISGYPEAFSAYPKMFFGYAKKGLGYPKRFCTNLKKACGVAKKHLSDILFFIFRNNRIKNLKNTTIQAGNVVWQKNCYSWHIGCGNLFYTIHY